MHHQNDFYGHHKHPRKLKELTDAAVARLLLRRIWFIQDEYRKYLGRHPRNRLLEAAMHLLPLNEIARHIDIDTLPLGEIMAEAERRRSLSKKHSEKAYRQTPELSEISDMELAGLLLRRLKSLYRKEKHGDLLDRFREERELLNEALAIFPKKPIRKPLPWREDVIIREADVRNAKRYGK